MTRGLFRGFIAVFTILAMSAGLVQPAFAGDPVGRNINIFRIDGNDASLTRGANSFTPREGQRLASGNVLSTGLDTFVYLHIDDDSIFEMDQRSQVVVTSTSQNRLSMAIQSGAALVVVDPQKAGASMETRIGNTALAVRGTMYVMGRNAEGDVTIAMLTGLGDVNGRSLPGGSMMTVRSDKDKQQITYTISQINTATLDAFTLKSMYEHLDYLRKAGTFSPEQLDAVPGLLVKRQEELRQEQAEEAAAQAQNIPPVTDEVVVLPPNLPEPPITPIPETDSGSNSTPTPEPTSTPTPTPTPEPSPEPTPEPTPTPNPPTGPNTPVVPAGTGTAINPFQIAVPGNLLWMAYNPAFLDKHFVLIADIDATSLDRPIGRNGVYITNFTGVFEGNGHAITLNISTSGQSNVGLFATIGAGGIVRNLEVRGSVSGSNNVGGIAGSILGTGTVTNSSSFANVNGIDSVGGLVGSNGFGGNIMLSFATGAINGTARAGGLVGVNSGAIRNSYATGNVDGNHRIGGIAGENVSGTIQMVYAMGRIMGNNNVGGLVGSIDGGALQHGVALNGNVDGSSEIGRAVGSVHGSVALHFIYARENMLLDGIPVSSASDLSTDGADLSIATLLPLWWTNQQFSSTHWNFTSMGVPYLQNVPNPASQNPFFPPVVTMFSFSADAFGVSLAVPPPITAPGGSDAAPSLPSLESEEPAEPDYVPDMKLPEEDESLEEETEEDTEEEPDEDSDDDDDNDNDDSKGDAEEEALTSPETLPESEDDTKDLFEELSVNLDGIFDASEDGQMAAIRDILWKKNT